MQQAEARMLKAHGMKSLLLTTGLSVAVFCGTAIGQTAGQDMHDAGHETKAAAQDTGHATKRTTGKAYHKTKHGTKKVANKTENGTKKVWHKTENLGDRIADKPEKH
jgi:hypothetical protein